mgnify:CR=1 FL=1
MSPDDLALFNRVLPGNTALVQGRDFLCDAEDISALLQAARAEERGKGVHTADTLMTQEQPHEPRRPADAG